MKLRSKRLNYIRYTQNDLPYYLQLATNSEVMKYITGRALTEEEGRERFKRVMASGAEEEGTGSFLAFSKADGKYVGFGKLVITDEGEAEIGYALFPEFWGQGYASEIAAFFTDYARRLGRFRRLIAIVHPDNPGSKRILEKLGFTLYKRGEIDGLSAEYYELEL